MRSFYKKLLVCFAVFQLISLQAIAETSTRIAYTSGWSSQGVTEALNNELNFAQRQACNEGKFFELVDIEIDAAWGNAYILYNISDRMGQTNPATTQIASVHAVKGVVLAEKLQDQINFLQDAALHADKHINFINMKIQPTWKTGFIIYEISE